jgi:sugar-specific transcriptional regulator TrmB
MTDILKKIGLTDSESTVYQALAAIGRANVSTLSVKTRIYRTNLYDVLEGLRSKGLVTSVIQDRVRYYSITAPANLLVLIEQEKQSLRASEQELLAYVKTIKPVAHSGGNKRIFVYQDREGLEFFYERLIEIAKSRDEVQIIGSSGTILGVFNYYMLNLSKKIKDINVPVRMIANRDLVRNAVMQRIMGLVDLDLRLLPRGHVSPVAVFIFRGHVGFCNFMENPFVIVIEDASITKVYKLHFEELWRLASPKDVLDER